MADYTQDIIYAKLLTVYPNRWFQDVWNQFWLDNGGYPGATMFERLGALGATGSSVQERLYDFFVNVYTAVVSYLLVEDSTILAAETGDKLLL